MTFRPASLDQPDDLTCVDTTAALIVNRVTVDSLRPDPLQIRRKTGITTRGITYMEAAEAVASLYDVNLSPRFHLSRDQVRDLVASGRPIGISIDTSVTRNTNRHTGSFIGGHTVYVNRYRSTPTCSCERALAAGNSHSEFQIEDPGTFRAGFRWWSAGLLYKAAEARTNGNGINVLVGRDTEDVDRTCVGAGEVRAKPDKDAASKESLVPGKSYAVVSTRNGGDWLRDDGSAGKGWHKVTLTETTEIGYIRGEALK